MREEHTVRDGMRAMREVAGRRANRAPDASTGLREIQLQW